jgi:hypothetical protein
VLLVIVPTRGGTGEMRIFSMRPTSARVNRRFQKTSIFVENTPVSQPIENAGYKYPRFIGHDLPGLTADERAVRNARCRRAHRGFKHPRWTAVMDAFAVGSGYAKALCRRYGLDPDHMVSR